MVSAPADPVLVLVIHLLLCLGWLWEALSVTLFLAGLGLLAPVLTLALGLVLSTQYLLHENMN